MLSDQSFTEKLRQKFDKFAIKSDLQDSIHAHRIHVYSIIMTYLRSIGEVIVFLVLSGIAILEGIIRSFIPKRYKMKSIDGEIALVTGGGGGLGRLLSLRLANLGAIVIVWDINKSGEIKKQISKSKKILKF